jgi:hypothetical protein
MPKRWILYWASSCAGSIFLEPHSFFLLILFRLSVIWNMACLINPCKFWSFQGLMNAWLCFNLPIWNWPATSEITNLSLRCLGYILIGEALLNLMESTKVNADSVMNNLHVFWSRNCNSLVSIVTIGLSINNDFM